MSDLDVDLLLFTCLAKFLKTKTDTCPLSAIYIVILIFFWPKDRIRKHKDLTNQLYIQKKKISQFVRTWQLFSKKTPQKQKQTEINFLQQTFSHVLNSSMYDHWDNYLSLSIIMYWSVTRSYYQHAKIQDWKLLYYKTKFHLLIA